MTQINPDDPKWTAYALGELDGSDRAAVEAELASSEEARMLIEDLRFAAELTKSELHEGLPFKRLLPEQRQAIYGSADAAQPVRRRWFKLRPAIWIPSAAAACIALMVITLTPARSPIAPSTSSRISALVEGAYNGAPAQTVSPQTASEAASKDESKTAGGFSSRYQHPTAPAEKDKKAADAINKEKQQSDPAVLQQLRIISAPTDAEGGNAKSIARFSDAAALATVARQAEEAAPPPPPPPAQKLVPQFFPAPPSGSPSAPGLPANAIARRRDGSYNGAESYNGVIDSPFLSVAQNPLSTFSIDVETASYSNVRRFINQNQLPPRDAVRIEEMINYFNYDYPQPPGNDPVSASIEAASAPWNPQHRLVRVGIKAREVEQMSGTLVTVAKDVKVQVEFNPAVVDAYRLIGYENRASRNEDFNDDKDAGDMGAGHTVTMLYEVVPRGVSINGPGVDPLKSQPAAPPAGNVSNETLNLKIRYKEPAASASKLLAFPLVDREKTFSKASVDFRFAAAVAEFGMILRDSPYKGTATIGSLLSIAEDGIGSDKNGYRREFLQLVQRTRQLRGER
jgi:hypothetical protein